MVIFAIVLSAIIVGIALVELAIASYFFNTFLKLPSMVMPRREQDLASVLVAVRGCDPTLRDSITGLMSQNYVAYDVHVVIDNAEGQAWQMVQEVKAEFDLHDRLHIHELATPLTTCGLKCSALLQAVGEVDPATEYLVLMDADVFPHAGWLSELTGPLRDPEIGAVTGNQWFEPLGVFNIGSFMRSLWGAAALVLSVLFRNPWAGSFAMRMEDFHESGLREMWSSSVIDDGPIRAAIHPLNLKIAFAPSLVMVNDESCTAGFVGRYVTRMLTWSKLFESTFWTTVLCAVANLGIVAGVLACIVTACTGALSVSWLAMLAVACVVGLLLSVISYVLVRNAVRHSCELRNESLPAMKFGQILKLEMLIPVMMVVFGVSCFRALFVRKIEWRKVKYEINSRYDVRVVEYQPWEDGEGAQGVSI